MDTNDGADQELVEKGQSAGASEKSPPAQTNRYDHWLKSEQMLGYDLLSILFLRANHKNLCTFAFHFINFNSIKIEVHK